MKLLGSTNDTIDADKNSEKIKKRTKIRKC